MAEYEALSPEARAWIDSKAEKFETNAIDGEWKKGADDAVARDALDKGIRDRLGVGVNPTLNRHWKEGIGRSTEATHERGVRDKKVKWKTKWVRKVTA